MELRPGLVVDRYRIEARLGSGGMAQVYLVRHRDLDSLHALKILTLGSDSIRKRLIQEGRIQSTLRHPNVVSVTDLIDVEGSPGLIMEFVPGPTLQQLLETTRLTVEQADGLARGIMRGVEAAHAHGLVHRDLKPANILIESVSGELVAKVCDFGLAKVLVTDSTNRAQTQTGALMGSPPYMAPEQIRDSSNVDARTDVFSLGTVLYELVTGQRPFDGPDQMEIFKQICAGTYTPIGEAATDLPPRIRDAVANALRVDPSERFPSVTALLEAWSEDSHVPSRDLSLNDPSWAPQVRSLFSESAILGSEAIQPAQEEPTEGASDTLWLDGSSAPVPPVRDAARPSETLWVDPNESVHEDVSEARAPAPKPPNTPTPLRWPFALGALLFLGVALALWGAFPQGNNETRAQQEARGLLSFEIDDQRDRDRFARAKEAFHQGQFPMAADLLTPLMADHPEQPAPMMLAVMVGSFLSMTEGEVIDLLDRMQKVPDAAHPSAVLGKNLFRMIHNNYDASSPFWAEQKDLLASQLGDDDVLDVLALFPARALSSHLEDLQPENLRVSLVARQPNRTLTHILVARSWLNDLDQPGASEAFRASVAAGLATANHPSYLLFLRGQFEQYTGDSDAAAASFIQVLQIDPTLSVARDHLISVYLEVGDDENRLAQVAQMMAATTSDTRKKDFCYHHSRDLMDRGQVKHAIDMMACHLDIVTSTGNYAAALESQSGILDQLLILSDIETYPTESERVVSWLVQPEVPEETRQGFSTLKLYYDSKYNVISGNLPAAKTNLARLRAVPESSFKFQDKTRAIQRLESWILIEEGQWDTVRESLPSFPFRCRDRWIIPALAQTLWHAEGPEVALERLSRPAPPECDEIHEAHFLPTTPLILSDLAALQMSMGMRTEAHQTLERFDEIWPAPDSELPAVRQIASVRSQLTP